MTFEEERGRTGRRDLGASRPPTRGASREEVRAADLGAGASATSLPRGRRPRDLVRRGHQGRRRRDRIGSRRRGRIDVADPFNRGKLQNDALKRDYDAKASPSLDPKEI